MKDAVEICSCMREMVFLVVRVVWGGGVVVGGGEKTCGQRTDLSATHTPSCLLEGLNRKSRTMEGNPRLTREPSARTMRSL